MFYNLFKSLALTTWLYVYHHQSLQLQRPMEKDEVCDDAVAVPVALLP